MAEVWEVEASGCDFSADHDGKLNYKKNYLLFPEIQISTGPQLLIQIAMNLKDTPLLNLFLRHLTITVPVHDIVEHVVQILHFRNRRHEYHYLGVGQDADVRQHERQLLLFGD